MIPDVIPQGVNRASTHKVLRDRHNNGGNDMNIVYALTRHVYHKILPSVRSLMEYNPKAKVFILCEDDTFPIELPCNAQVINVSGQEFFKPSSINYNNQFKYINLLKVCYPLYLKCNKVIHLDIDTIINESLEPLWKTNLQGKWFAACPEYKGRYKPFGETYYNMGVAVINLQAMRKDNIIMTMVDYLNSVRQPWADQDAWNKYGIEQDKVVAFPIRYNENVMTGTTDNPAIVHYCSIGDWYENRSIPRREYLNKWM